MVNTRLTILPQQFLTQRVDGLNPVAKIVFDIRHGYAQNSSKEMINPMYRYSKILMICYDYV